MRSTVMLGAVLAGWLAVAPTSAAAQLTPVPAANTKAPGVVKPNVLSPELAEVVRAAGAMLLENPESPAKYYGYNDDGPNLVPLPGSNVEAQKTEPDKNTYLVLHGQKGADPNYDYGTHFLFQGHETGPSRQGYITRINLDADVAHRVTLHGHHATSTATPLPTFDGSTWYPFAQRLLFTAENGNAGGVWQATARRARRRWRTSRASSAAAATRASRPTRSATSGSSRTSVARAARANTRPSSPTASSTASFRTTRHDLTAGGKLQVLQVKSLAARPAHRLPRADADADITSQDVHDLHTYGKTFDDSLDHHPRHRDRRHDAVRRQRAGQGGGRHALQASRERRCSARAPSFREFFFTETGDTNALTAGRLGRRRLRRHLQAHPEHPGDDHGHALPLLPRRRRRTPASTTSRSCTRGPRARRSRTRATALHTPAQRARLRLAVRRRTPTTRIRRTSRSGSSPQGRDASATIDSRSAGLVRASTTTATTRSPASTSRTATRRWAASSAPRSRSRSTAWLAGLLHPAARRQHHVRDHPESLRGRADPPPRSGLGRRLGRLPLRPGGRDRATVPTSGLAPAPLSDPALGDLRRTGHARSSVAIVG